MLKAWFLLVFVSLLFVGPVTGQRPSLQDPALYTAAPQPAWPAAKEARPVAYKLSPGVSVFGWLPYWLPDSTYGHYNYSLLSHVAYHGYQANSKGELLLPTGNPAALVQAAHQSKASCKVLLSISYQEPAAGASLFDTTHTAQRQALVQGIVAQVGKAKADGVNLDFSFTRRAAAPKRYGPAEAARLQASLQKKLVALVQAREQIRADSIRFFNVQQQQELAQLAPPSADPKNKAPDKNLKPQEAALGKRAKAHQKNLARYHGELAAFEQRMAPPRAVLQDFVEDLVQVLRQQNPAYVLTLTVPAVDSAAAYTRLADLAPLVQLFVLEAYDYTSPRPVAPGPIAPLRTQNVWGQSSIETSLRYYQRGGIPPAQLLVTFAQVGKVWREVPSSPASPASRKPSLRKLPPAPFRYVANHVWQTWPVQSKTLDAASGSVYVRFRTNPDSAAAGLAPVHLEGRVDDALALAAKYQWLRQQGFGGVGIWALGYEADSTTAEPLVRAGLVLAPQRAGVAAKRAQPAPQVEKKASILHGLLEGHEQANIILFILALMLGFALLGFGFGIARNLRHILPFRTRLVRTGLLLALGLVIFSTYVLLLVEPDKNKLLARGFPLVCMLVVVLVYSNLRPPRAQP
jgi:hypothetical protein